jgi:hypothetical protein
MRALPVLLGCCLASSIAGAVWLLTADLQPPLPPEPATAAAPTDGAPSGEVPRPVAADATLRTDGEGADGAEPGADENAANDGRTEVAMDERHAPKVLVVRAGTPVADAIVYFVTEPDANKRLGSNPRGLTRWEWPQELGQRAVTGADGIAALPVGTAPWLCAATAGDDFGVATVPPRDRTQTITLQADEHIRLHARTPDQAPAPGVPLAIVQQFGKDEGRVLWQAPSDPRGDAVVRHFQLLRENRNDAATVGERFAGLAAVPGATAVEFAGRPAPRDDLTLLLPPLGSLRVHLVDHAGNALLSRATVGLSVWTQPAFASASQVHLPGRIAVHRVDKPPGADPVVLPWQQVGTPVVVFARFPFDRRPADSGPVPGPAQAGGSVDVKVPLRDTQAVLAGRFVIPASALLPDAAPLGDSTVDAALWNAERETQALAIDTVRDGRFDLVLGQRTDATEYWLELRLDPARAPVPTPTYDNPPPPPPRLGARVRVPAIRGGTRIELGTIALVELPVLVTGLVVDDTGQAVADADVQVQQEEPVPARNERGRDPWRNLSLFHARTDADGRFRIDGQIPPGKLRVRADTDKHFADSVPLYRQGQDVRIKIDRNGVLRGRVLLPDWMPDGVASLQLRPFDEGARKTDTRSIDLSRRSGGRFVIEPLRPGRFDALVLVRNLPEPLATLQDVFVQPGETRDARFRPLDLRQALHRYRLRAVDAAGAPLALDGPILARFAKQDGALAEASFRWQKGRAELIATSPSVDMTFFGRGHQTLRQQVWEGDSEIRLLTTRPALVDLPGLRALCGPTRKVRISAILQGDTGLPASFNGVDQRTGERFGFQRWDLGRSSGGWLGVTDSVEIPLLTSGKYELLLRPHATDTERSTQGQLSLGVFDLQVDSASWQPVRVPLDTSAVLQMLQQLDQGWAQAQAQAQQNGSR